MKGGRETRGNAEKRRRMNEEETKKPMWDMPGRIMRREARSQNDRMVNKGGIMKSKVAAPEAP